MELEDKIQEQILSTEQETSTSSEQQPPQVDTSPETPSQPEPESEESGTTQETQNEQQNEQSQPTTRYWYEQIPPHEFQRIKAQYWKETVPVVAKEIGMDQTELVSMLTALGIDSPDLITDLRKTIASIDAERKRVTEDNKIVKENTRKVDNSDTIKGKSWYEIAEIIKTRRGIK